MKAPSLLLLAALASLAAARAEQEVLFTERTPVAVSAEDLNVLVAEDGEITSAVANESELRIVHQDGRIYFRVLAANKQVPLFVGVQRQDGSEKLYTLLLNPVESLAAERVVIRNLEPDNPPPAAAPGSTPEPRLREIKALVLAMARGWELEGYRITERPRGIQSSPGAGLRIELARVHGGAEFRGETWLVRNIGRESLDMREIALSLGASPLAVAFGTPQIAPNQEGTLYLVKPARAAQPEETR